jgi:cytochrome d ubiquinol oxidase subunit II
VLAGVFGLLAIGGHGATFLAWKTDGAVQARSRRAATWLYAVVAVFWPLLTLATIHVNREMFAALPRRPLAWLSVLIALAGLISVGTGLRAGRDRRAFLGSCAFLAGLLAATAACVFPVMLRAVDAGGPSLDAYNSSVPARSLEIALAWWGVGFPLAVLYFVALFRIHRGKAVAAEGRDGY